MIGLKAFACMEPYENTGGILFAKSNIEARKWAANEWHDGDIAGMSVKRAQWADKYGSGSKIPIADMVDVGWHFECMWSGLRIDSDLYENPRPVYNEETKEWKDDDFLVGKSPVGFQNTWGFACQEYADLYDEKERKRKEFEEEWLKYYRGLVLKTFPDAILIPAKENSWQGEHIYSSNGIVQSVTIPFEFPGVKHWAALKVYREYSQRIGPIQPHFTCAQGDLEEFEKWAKEQKNIIKVS